MSELFLNDNTLRKIHDGKRMTSEKVDLKSVQKMTQDKKNMRWKDEEHILYILFLENNREKTKSKLIRRSNSFFKEMSDFIGTKTGIQCRSHHQKYEAKHKFPHKIISEEKEKFDQGLYHDLRKKIIDRQTNSDQHTKEPVRPEPIKNQSGSCAQSKDVECQTQLQGVHQYLMPLNPFEVHSYRVALQSQLPFMNHLYWDRLRQQFPFDRSFSFM